MKIFENAAVIGIVRVTVKTTVFDILSDAFSFLNDFSVTHECDIAARMVSMAAFPSFFTTSENSDQEHGSSRWSRNVGTSLCGKFSQLFPGLTSAEQDRSSTIAHVNRYQKGVISL